MAGFPQVGVLLVAEGIESFLGLMADAAGAVVGFVGDSISVAGDFEAGMNQFAAAAGDALDQSGMSLEQFRDQFIAMGRELPVSTAEVQEAAIELVKGGIDPATISAGGLRTALDLAAAGGIGLAESAEILANQLGVWVDASASAADKAAFLTQSANLLSQAANVTTKDVDDMALGLANVGGVAELAGLNFQETVQTMALISPNFASAADAGTSFKTFLNGLIPTTSNATGAMMDLGLYTKEAGAVFYDAQGNFVGMERASQLLYEATKDLTQEQRSLALETIFGSDAQRAAAAIAAAGAEGYAAMGAQMSAAGTVAEQAAARQKGFNTAIENAKGSIEAFQITIGTALLPVLTDLLNNYIAPGINWLTTFADALLGNMDAFFQLSPAVQGVIYVLQGFVDFFSTGALDQLYSGLTSLFGADTAGLIVDFASALREGDFAGAFGVIAEQVVAAAPAILAALGEWTLAFFQWTMDLRTQLAIGLVEALPGIIETLGTWTAAFTQWAVESIPVVIEAFGNSLMQIGTAVVEALPSILEALAGFAPIVADSAAQIGGAILTGILGPIPGLEGQLSAALSSIGAVVSAVLSSLAQFWGQNGQQILATAQQTWQAVQQAVGGVLTALFATVSTILGQVAIFWQNNGQQILAFVASAWQQIGSIIQTALQLASGIVQGVLAVIVGFVQEHGNSIQHVLTNAWQVIQGVIQGALAIIQGLLSAALAIFKGDWEGAWTAIQNMSVTVVQALGNIIEGGLEIIAGLFGTTLTEIANTWQSNFENIAQWARDKIEEIKGFFAQFGIDAEALGADIIQGIMNGISASGGALIDTLVDLAAQALAAAQEALGISSPSTVFADDVGKPISLGIAEGIAAQTDAVIAAGAGVAQALLDSMATMDEEAQQQAEDTANAILAELERLAEESAALLEKVLSDALSGLAGLARGQAGAENLIESLFPKTSEIAKAEKAMKDAQKRISDLSTPTAQKKSKTKEDLEAIPGQREARAGKLAGDLEDLDEQRRLKQDQLGLDLAAVAAERERAVWTSQHNDSLEKREQAAQKILDLDQKARDLQAKFDNEQLARDQKADDLRTKAADDLLALETKEGQLRERLAAEQADYQAKEEARLAKLKQAQDDLANAQFAQNRAQQEYAEQAEIAAQAERDIAKAAAEAQEIAKTDPKLANDYYNMRVKQIGELARLHIEQAQTDDTIEQNRIARRIDLLKQAQQFEAATFEQAAQKRAEDLTKAIQDAETTGNAVVDGMIKGVQDKASSLSDAMVGAVTAALEEVRRQFGMTSPSLVWAEQVGAPLMEGVGAGLSAALPGVETQLGQAMARLTTATAQPASAATYYQQSSVVNAGGNTININGTTMNQSQLVSLVAQAMDASGQRADTRMRMR